MTDLQDLLEQKPITKLPGRFWNWWDCYKTVPTLCGGVIQKGVHPGHKPYPSKDIAETLAANWLKENRKTSWKGKYLGAFPEGETP